MYKSPIEMLYKQRTEVDNMIYRAVLDVGVVVDKDELLKALEYDRGQYEKGYADALARDDVVEVVRCMDCKHYNTEGHRCVCEYHSEVPTQYSRGFNVQMLPCDFCSYGERKEGDDSDG